MPFKMTKRINDIFQMLIRKELSDKEARRLLGTIYLGLPEKDREPFMLEIITQSTRLARTKTK
jgi:hypothetical protein